MHERKLRDDSGDDMDDGRGVLEEALKAFLTGRGITPFLRTREVSIASRSARGRAPTLRRFDLDLMRRASVYALTASVIVPRESSRDGGTGRERDV
jgi:hypothetical protein